MATSVSLQERQGGLPIRRAQGRPSRPADSYPVLHLVFIIIVVFSPGI
jgi:hypothetical protein